MFDRRLKEFVPGKDNKVTREPRPAFGREQFQLPELRSHWISRALGRVYGTCPERGRVTLIAVIWRLEGGQLRSGTARALLERHHGVTVGAFSYGSLLVPGMAQAGTTIGRYVSVGPNVRRYNTNHPIDAPSLHPYWYNPILGFADATQDAKRTEIEICDDAWIGANVVILPGCRRIGTGAVVGAGAIVTKDVDDFAVVAGVPATERTKRLSPHLRRRLLDENPWRLPPVECDAVIRSLTEHNG